MIGSLSLSLSLIFLALSVSSVSASVIPTTGQLIPRGNAFESKSPDVDVIRRRRSSETNAERFARGLPPSKPKRLYEPNRRQAGGTPSNLPTSNGYILVSDYNTGAPLGYLSNTPLGDGEFQLTNVATNYLIAQVPTSSSPIENVNIYATNGLGVFAQDPWLALIDSAPSPDFELSSNTGIAAYFGGAINTTPPDTPLQHDANSLGVNANFDASTAIWNVAPLSTVVPITFSITATYTNSQNAQIPAYMVYASDPSLNEIFFTGNVADFINEQGIAAQQVSFTFVPI